MRRAKSEWRIFTGELSSFIFLGKLKNDWPITPSGKSIEFEEGPGPA